MGKFFNKIMWVALTYIVLCISFTSIAQVVKTGICISYDGKTMIYTGDDHGRVQFYQADKNVMWKWGEGTLIQNFNQYLDSAIVIKDPFLSYDGQTLFFSLSVPGSSELDIYYSQLKNGKWQEPKPMSETINTDEDEESPSLTADNRYLYFTRKAMPAKPLADEEYCRTIYRSVRDVEGNWQKPELVKVSSVGCEAYPLISPNGNILLFSSAKLPQKRKQKYDVYYVKEDMPGVWSTPLPIDALNTEANDVSAAIDFQTKQIYALQVEQVKKEKQSKLATVAFPEGLSYPTFSILYAVIKDLDSKAPVPAIVSVRDPITLGLINTVQNDEQGNLKLLLLNGKKYKFDYYVPGYSQYSKYYDFSNTSYGHVDTDSVFLFKTVSLKLNIYDKSVFKPINANVTVVEADNIRKFYDVKELAIAGQFLINLPVGKKYNIKVEDIGYAPHIFSFDISQTMFFNKFEEDIALIADGENYTINVISTLNDSLMNARVNISNVDIDELINVKDIKAGTFAADLRKDNNYTILITQKGYYFDNRMITTHVSNEDTINVKLVPLLKEVKIALPTVKFVNNTSDLTTESYSELNNLVNLMLENPEVIVEIGAYTDNKADAAYCNRLTTYQARSVGDYLVLRGGITKDRITSKGYGKSIPSDLQYTGNFSGDKEAHSLIWLTIVEPARGIVKRDPSKLVHATTPGKTPVNETADEIE
ncbi:MAG: OmpA family protein [Prevotellaceae bacterium]|jgi:outer membrane protein OmpA-like peptidoglycan-associated protein|nr:OmpA family protein [Prevotellaceae bacterium]